MEKTTCTPRFNRRKRLIIRCQAFSGEPTRATKRNCAYLRCSWQIRRVPEAVTPAERNTGELRAPRGGDWHDLPDGGLPTPPVLAPVAFGSPLELIRVARRSEGRPVVARDHPAWQGRLWRWMTQPQSARSPAVWSKAVYSRQEYRRLGKSRVDCLRSFGETTQRIAVCFLVFPHVPQLRDWVLETQVRIGKSVARSGGAHLRRIGTFAPVGRNRPNLSVAGPIRGPRP
jgi:hypothetical protein